MTTRTLGHIVVAEDNPAMQYLIQTHLKAGLSNYEILLAHDGQHALEIIEKIGFSNLCALVTDIEMPRLSGPGLAKRVRQLESQHSLETTPIVFQTSNPGDYEHHAKEFGVPIFCKSDLGKIPKYLSSIFQPAY